jgi:hypothetical protein
VVRSSHTSDPPLLPDNLELGASAPVDIVLRVSSSAVR